MKHIFFLLLVLFFIESSAQKIEGKSKSTTFNLSNSSSSNTRLVPPVLSLVPNTLTFTDDDGNKSIDAGEKAIIKFSLQNTGKGDATNLVAKVSTTSKINGLSFTESTNLGNLAAGKTQWIEIPISASNSLSTGTTSFNIKIDEANGFGADPIVIEINTKEKAFPMVKVADHTVTCENSSTIVKKKPFEMQVLVQNIGQGKAEEVKLGMTIPANVICLSANENVDLGILKSGDKQIITYSLIVNELYNNSTIPVKFSLTESLGKYAENKSVEINLNQAVSPNKIIVQSDKKNDVVTTIQIATLTADVDKNIPETNLHNVNAFALIIGNEDYSSHQQGLNTESNVDFAKNDAKVFGDYCSKTLGVPTEHITYLPDATAGSMNQAIDKLNKLAKAYSGKAELIFYYSGHGLPDETTKDSYLIPVDVNGNDLKNAIKLSDVYQKLTEFPSNKVTVFIDACFSGGGRNKSLLASRAIKINPKKETLNGNIVSFSACSGDQVSLPNKDKQHGMFTYYLLKKLQDTKGEVSYKDLSDYLKAQVSQQSILINNKEQTPSTNSGQSLGSAWETWKIR